VSIHHAGTAEVAPLLAGPGSFAEFVPPHDYQISLQPVFLCDSRGPPCAAVRKEAP
jgi:hypothetical protein